MVVDHSYGLHERVADCRSYELEPSFSKILAHQVGLLRRGGNLSQIFVCMLDGFTVHETPDIIVEGSKLFANLLENYRVSNRCFDLQSVSHDARVNKKTLHINPSVPGNLG